MLTITPGADCRIRIVTLVEGVPTDVDEVAEVLQITAVLYRNGSASGVTVTPVATSKTGEYDLTFTLPSLGGSLSVGDRLQLDYEFDVESETYESIGAAWEAIVVNNDANLVSINGDTTSVNRMKRSADSIALGTVDDESTTQIILVKSINPEIEVSDQFVGKVVMFPANTTTVELRGQISVVESVEPFYDGWAIYLKNPLTNAPQEDDIFTLA